MLISLLGLVETSMWNFNTNKAACGAWNRLDRLMMNGRDLTADELRSNSISDQANPEWPDDDPRLWVFFCFFLMVFLKYSFFLFWAVCALLKVTHDSISNSYTARTTCKRQGMNFSLVAFNGGTKRQGRPVLRISSQWTTACQCIVVIELEYITI